MIAASDQFQHGWDLARATGQAANLDPDVAAKLLEFAQMAIPDTSVVPRAKHRSALPSTCRSLHLPPIGSRGSSGARRNGSTAF